jgi:hypothetical protein
MRIWDVPPDKLCRKHLLGEHAELHAIWTILTQERKGYSRHPETMRWKGKLKALYERHQLLVDEMTERGYKHNSRLSRKLAIGDARQDVFIDSYDEQCDILRQKRCGCMGQ